MENKQDEKAEIKEECTGNEVITAVKYIWQFFNGYAHVLLQRRIIFKDYAERQALYDWLQDTAELLRSKYSELDYVVENQEEKINNKDA